MDLQGKVVSLVEWVLSVYPRIHRLTVSEMDYELHKALAEGNEEFIKLKMEESSSVPLQYTPQRDSPLHICARKGHLSIVKTLLSDLSQRDVVLQTWKLLLLKNDIGNTPLHEAIRESQSQSALSILQSQPWMAGITNKRGETPLFLACDNGDKEVVRGILDVSNHNILDMKLNDGQTCTHIAAFKGHLDILQMIVQYSPSNKAIKVPDKLGLTPLHSAVLGGQLHTMDYLIQKEPKLCYKQDKGGRCPIHIAAIKGDSAIISKMSFLNSDFLNMRSGDGKSILHYAVQSNQLELVQWIISNADVKFNEQDSEGNGVFHLAAMNCLDNQMLSLLLGEFSHATLNLKNKEGYTPLALLVNKGSSTKLHGIRKVLEQAGALKIPEHVDEKEDIENSQKRSLKNTALVAALIATIAASAPLQMKGDNDCTGFNAKINDKYCQDYAKTVGNFVILNTAALYSSLTVLIMWLTLDLCWKGSRRPCLKICRFGLIISIYSTYAAFGHAMQMGTWNLFSYGYNYQVVVYIIGSVTATLISLSQLFVFTGKKTEKGLWDFNTISPKYIYAEIYLIPTLFLIFVYTVGQQIL